MLVEQLGAEQVSVGENFRFGRRARGDAALLRAQDAFETRVVELVTGDGEVISSSLIRGLIAAGEVERANECLGSPFQLRGPVAHGDKRGRTLGYPTANLVPGPGAHLPRPRRLRLPRGGRAGRRVALVAGGDERRRAARRSSPGAGCSSRRSCSTSTATSTAASCGWSFLSRLRGELKFDSVDALVEQMARDVDDTRRIAA